MNSELVKAAESGNLDKVFELYNKGAYIHVGNEEPLRRALLKNKMNVVRFLIDNGADITIDNYSVFRKAFSTGCFDLIDKSIENGANVDMIDKNTILSIFEKSDNYVELIKFIIEEGKNVSCYNNIMICNAAKYGSLELLEYLTNKGVDVNHIDNISIDKMFNSMRCVVLVKFLIEKGFNVMCSDNVMTCSAIKYGNIELFEYITQKGNNVNVKDNSYFLTAVKYGHTGIADYFLNKGYDIHMEDDKALCFAIRDKQYKMVKFLIEKGADIHAQNDYAICMACMYVDMDIIEFLVRHGANVNAQNNTPINWGQKHNNLNIIKFLIDNGADAQCISAELKMRLGIFTWFKKPNSIGNFRMASECPISGNELNESVPQLGCSNCLNVFEKESLEEWFKHQHFNCPMCRVGNIFYLV